MTPLPLEKLEARRPDYLLLASTIALLVLGTLMVYSASFVGRAQRVQRRRLLPGAPAAVDRRRRGRHAGRRCAIDYRRWRTLSLPIMFVVHRPAGAGAGAGHRLQQLRRGALDQARPGLQIQPSEIAKLAIVAVPGRLAGAARRRSSASSSKGCCRSRSSSASSRCWSRSSLTWARRRSSSASRRACSSSAGANLLHIALVGDAPASSARRVAAGAPERVSARPHPRVPRPVERHPGQRLAHRPGPDRARLGRPVRARPGQRPAEVLLGTQRPHRRDLRDHRRGAGLRRLRRRAGSVRRCWRGAGS